MPYANMNRDLLPYHIRMFFRASWLEFLLLSSPPGNPRDKVSPCGPDVGKLVLSRGYGVGIVEVSNRARNYGAKLASGLLCWGIPSICMTGWRKVYKTCIWKNRKSGALKAKETRTRKKHNELRGAKRKGSGTSVKITSGIREIIGLRFANWCWKPSLNIEWVWKFAFLPWSVPPAGTIMHEFGKTNLIVMKLADTKLESSEAYLMK